MDKRDIKNLKKRYLIWFYKTTKEELDKIERKFTQLEIDRFILKELKNKDKEKRAEKFIAEFHAYILSKEMDGIGLKYESKQFKAGYYFLVLKLKAVERSIIKELGNKSMDEIKALYEKEMTRRIMEQREEKR